MKHCAPVLTALLLGGLLVPSPLFSADGTLHRGPLPQELQGPAQEDGFHVYFGDVGIRSTEDGYVIAVSGSWGSRTFVYQSENAVAPVALLERETGRILFSHTDLRIILPSQAQVIRLAIPGAAPSGLEHQAAAVGLSTEETDSLVARFGEVSFLEVLDGFEVAIYGSTLRGLGLVEILVYSDEAFASAVNQARGIREVEGHSSPYFNRDNGPDPAIGGGCSSGGEGSTSCSIQGCTGSPSGCSTTCSPPRYACCKCDDLLGDALCKCN